MTISAETRHTGISNDVSAPARKVHLQKVETPIDPEASITVVEKTPLQKKRDAKYTMSSGTPKYTKNARSNRIVSTTSKSISPSWTRDNTRHHHNRGVMATTDFLVACKKRAGPKPEEACIIKDDDNDDITQRPHTDDGSVRRSPRKKQKRERLFYTERCGCHACQVSDESSDESCA